MLEEQIKNYQQIRILKEQAEQELKETVLAMIDDCETWLSAYQVILEVKELVDLDTNILLQEARERFLRRKV